MNGFTPLEGAIGGALIGLAAGLMLLLNGRICGNSGIIAGAMFSKFSKYNWQIFFVLGLLTGAFIYQLFTQFRFTIQIDAPWWAVIIGGLLVGFGTRLGGGCTSGHGICGIARLSLRSVVATVIFLLTGILTVFIIRLLTVLPAFYISFNFQILECLSWMGGGYA